LLLAQLLLFTDPKEDSMAEELKQENTTEEESGKGKGGKFRLILLSAMLLVVIAAGAGYVFLGDKLLAKIIPGGGAPTSEKKKQLMGPIIGLEPFVFNISGSSTKFAKVTLGIEVKDPKIQEEAKKMVPAIRDKVLSVLGAKTPEILVDVKQREVLKKEIQGSVTGLFKSGSDIKAVYITDLIIQ
jgi:flagellar protein FliL